MIYRDLTAALERLHRLEAENACLRSQLDGPARDWLGMYVRSVLAISAVVVWTVSWWLVTSS